MQSLVDTHSATVRRLVRLGWMVLALNSLWVFGGLLSITWQLAHEPPPRLREGMSSLGMSQDVYFGINALVMLLWFASFFGVSTLLFLRLPGDPMALFAAILLMAFAGIVVPVAPEILQFVNAAPLYFTIPFHVNSYLAWPLAFPFAVLYPDGTFVPRWSRFGALYGFIWAVLWTTFLDAFSTATGLFGVLVTFSVILGAGIILYAQVYRYRHHSTPAQRQQTKWMLFGLAMVVILQSLAQIAIQVMLATPSPATSVTFELIALWAGLSTAFLPLAIGIAILRYRLWDIDVLINRTLVYVPLTALLAGIFAASITLSQKFFVALTGERSDAATVFTTLIVVAAFDPLKNGLQHVVERRFKEGADPSKKWKAYADELRSFVEMVDPEASLRRLLQEAVQAFGASSGAVYVQNDGRSQLVQTVGTWNGDVELSVHLTGPKDSVSVGSLALGPRQNGADYTVEDRASLQEISGVVARAIALAQRMDRAHV